MYLKGDDIFTNYTLKMDSKTIFLSLVASGCKIASGNEHLV